jgi:hypothetical protein
MNVASKNQKSGGNASRNKFPLGEASPGFILILNPPFCPLFLPLLTTATQLIPIIFTPFLQRLLFTTHYFFPPFLPSSINHIISSQTTMAMAIAMAATAQPITPTHPSQHN